MAATLTKVSVDGSMRSLYYTYTLSGGTLSVATGMTKIIFFSCQNTSDATAIYGSVSGGTITLTGASASTGYLQVKGY